MRLSNEQIRRKSESRFYLSQRSEEEKDRLMMEILERFSEPGNMSPPERMDEQYLLIRKFKDCAYIRYGVDGSLDETYKTTDSGKAYLRSFKNVIDRCCSEDGCYIPSEFRTGVRAGEMAVPADFLYKTSEYEGC